MPDSFVARYAPDTTISVHSSHLNDRDTKQAIGSSLTYNKTQEGTATITGASISYKSTRETEYIIKNNGEETALIYVDHVASMLHNGYTILPDEKCIKTAEGFARYRLVLQPGEEWRKQSSSRQSA